MRWVADLLTLSLEGTDCTTGGIVLLAHPALGSILRPLLDYNPKFLPHFPSYKLVLRFGAIIFEVIDEGQQVKN